MNKNLLNNKIFLKILLLNDELNKLIQEKSKDKNKIHNILYKIRVLQGILIKWLHNNLNKNKSSNNYYYNISILQNLIDETKIIINIAEANIQNIILNLQNNKGDNNNINNNKPTFILFYVNWCGYCKQFKPIWNDFTKRNKDKINIENVNCDIEIEKKEKYKVSSFPTLLLIDNNNISHKFTKNRTIENLENFIYNFL